MTDKEDIKLVENLIKEYKLYGDLDGIAINDMSVYINALEHLIEAYKEREEDNSLLIQQNITYKRNIHDLKHNNIPVSLIKEKIEEIDKEIEYQKLYGNVSKREELETKKEHFLELLEGE